MWKPPVAHRSDDPGSDQVKALELSCKKDFSSAAAWKGQSWMELWYQGNNCGAKAGREAPRQAGEEEKLFRHLPVTPRSGIFQLSCRTVQAHFISSMPCSLWLIYCTQDSLAIEFGSSGSSWLLPLGELPSDLSLSPTFLPSHS